MANKRQPLTFPELEGRGRRAILRSADEVQAEQETLTSTPEREPEIQNASIPDFQNASRTQYVKATYRLHPEAIDAIEDAKRILRRQYNLRVSLEEIAEQAVLAAYRDLLENQQTSNLYLQLARPPANKKARKPETERL
jgi:hypothetical protein